MVAHTAERALFASLAHDIKVPLLKIAFMAELAGDASDGIQKTSREALELLDAYLLGVELKANQAELRLEPVHPTALLADTLHEVDYYAKKFSCDLRLHAPAHVHTALMHRSAIQIALAALAKVFIEAQDVLGSSRRIVEVAAYNSSKGVSIGVFHAFDQKTLNTQLLAQAHSTLGQAIRPFAGLGSGASTYLFVAEQIVQALQSNLRSAKRGAMSGIAIDFCRSNQLSFIP